MAAGAAGPAGGVRAARVVLVDGFILVYDSESCVPAVRRQVGHTSGSDVISQHLSNRARHVDESPVGARDDRRRGRRAGGSCGRCWLHGMRAEWSTHWHRSRRSHGPLPSRPSPSVLPNHMLGYMPRYPHAHSATARCAHRACQPRSELRRDQVGLLAHGLRGGAVVLLGQLDGIL